MHAVHKNLARHTHKPDAITSYKHLKAHITKAAAPLMQKIQLALLRLKQIPRRQILSIAGVSVFIFIGTYAAAFLWPRTMVFSYADTNCFFNPVILPGLAAKQAGPTFAVETVPALSIAGYPIYSATTCVSLAKAPHGTTPEKMSIALFGSSFFKKTITVSSGAMPSVNAVALLDKPIAPQDPLAFTLSQADYHFDYRLTANDKSVTCQKKDAQFSCDVASLALAQGVPYAITVERLFRGESAGAVLQQNVTTVGSIDIAGVSIASNQIVYGVPADMTLTFTKPIASFDGLHLTRTDDGLSQDMGVTASTEGAVLRIRFNEPLARQAAFTITLAAVKANDGGYLPAPYAQQFTTSGGPKITHISIGTAKVQPGASFTLTFDSPLSGSQQLQNFIRVESGGNRLAATTSLRGNTVTVSPQGLDVCQAFTVKVIDGLQSDVGVSGGSGWQFNSRTTCRSTFSIGTSVLGRSITGYKFGNGPIKIVFVGTLHGNEKSATRTLDGLIAYLDANYGSIPADRTIIVIPNLNPDGYAANSRYNAHGIDLNRNFPANNWKSGVTMPDGSYHSQGGGAAALSEPESRALARYIAAEQPRLVLSYHAVAGLVAANESGDSRALATRYGQKSGYPSYGNEASSNFAYDTTGAFEDWLHDAHGIPGILVELYTFGSSEFNRHRNAIWEMVIAP